MPSDRMVEMTRLGGSEYGSAVHTNISTHGSLSPYLPNDSDCVIAQCGKNMFEYLCICPKIIETLKKSIEAGILTPQL